MCFIVEIIPKRPKCDIVSKNLFSILQMKYSFL
jgi:hypothetical protein